LIFENTTYLGPKIQPVGALLHMSYPHGLAFADDDRMLVVADAGAPFIHVYSREGSPDWSGYRSPLVSIRVMDDETFNRGRSSADEGGPKGLEISSELNVLATTSEHQPLAFFDLDAFIRPREPRTRPGAR
jgi:hypothetical protein